MRTIDLHIHSNFSDGTDSPRQLLAMAAEKNLGAIALTDHDTTAGIDCFMAAASDYPQLTAVPGLEVSTDADGIEMHIVGLFIDWRNAPLNELLAQIRASRDARNSRIIKKLKTLDYHLDLDELKSRHKGVIGRPHLAAELHRKYDFNSRQEIFERLLGRNTPAYEKRWFPPVAEVIKLIHEAGGTAVWAHPVKMNKRASRNSVRKTLKKMCAYDLDALEAYYSSYSDTTTNMLKELATEFSLLVSGGSDYHGSNQPGIQLGYGCNGEMTAPESLLSQFPQYNRSLEGGGGDDLGGKNP